MSITLLESGSRLLLEDGTSVALLEAVAGLSSYLLLESGSRLLLESGLDGLLLELPSVVSISTYPDPFGATVVMTADPFGSTALVAIDPFTATAKLKGN